MQINHIQKGILAMKTKLFFCSLMLGLSIPLGLGLQTSTTSFSTPIQDLRAGIFHPLKKGQVLAATPSSLYERDDRGVWKNLGFPSSPQEPIQKLKWFSPYPNDLWILTSETILRWDLTQGQSQSVFQTKTDETVQDMLLLPNNSEQWLVGTSQGLSSSTNQGLTWQSLSLFGNESILKLASHENILWVLSKSKLMRSENLGRPETVFRLHRSATESPSSSEEVIQEENEESPFSSKIHSDDFVMHPQNPNQLWLLHQNRIYQTLNAGKTWDFISLSGLESAKISILEFHLARARLYAGTDRGLFEYHEDQRSWHFVETSSKTGAILEILPHENPNQLSVISTTGYHPLSFEIPESLPQSVWFPDPNHLQLLNLLIQKEPSARKVQEKAIRYAGASGGKIKRWQAGSRLAALLPSFSFGKDISKNVSIDLDRGGTSDPDRYILGPEDVSEGWDMGVSWDLGDFIWSSAQTSIDSREKLLVELRQDIVSEVTRLYFERRKIQENFIHQRPQDETLYRQELLHMEELSALLSGLTNGWFEREIQKIYALHPELEELW